MRALLHDLRVSARLLRRRPAFSAMAIATMAVGIGATATILGAVDAVLFRTLPYAEPHQLVQVFGRFRPRPNMDRMQVAPANFADWRTGAATFARLAAYRHVSLNATGASLPERLRGAEVSGDLFDILGTPPALGRILEPKDARTGAEPVAVISDALWRRRFERDLAIVGKPLYTSTRAYTIVGVMPPPFRFPIGWIGGSDIEVWTPLALSGAEQTERGATTLNVIARLAPDVGIEQAQRRFDALTARLEDVHPRTNRNWATNLMPLSERGIINVRPMLMLLLVAVGVIMAIACANVANLLLARGLDRQRDLTIRAALGATRGRLVRQLLAEGLLLAAIGAVFGVLLAVWGTGVLRVLAPGPFVPELAGMHVSARVLALTAAVALIAGLAFSAVPALVHANVRIGEALQEGGRGGESRRRRRLTSALVVAEVALTFVLLASALAVVRSFTRYMAIDPGFEASGAVTMRVALPAARYPTPDTWNAFFERLEDEARALPGIASVGLAASTPMAGTGDVARYRIVGGTAPDSAAPIPNGAEVNQISPGYIRAAGIRVLRGRALATTDVAGAAPVAMVNEEFVRRAFPDDDPLGRHIVLQGDMNRGSVAADSSPPMEIVGVVADVKEYGLHLRTPPTILVPLRQNPRRTMSLIVRGSGDLAPTVTAVRTKLQTLDPEQAVYGVQSLEEQVANNHALLTFSTVLLGVFAVVALVLSLAGIFGVVAYTAGQQAREWALRMAVGASPRSVFSLILRRGCWLTAAGMAVGLVAAPTALNLLARAMKEGMNVDLLGTGAVMWAQVVVLMAAVAVMAGLLPARRAMRSDLVELLRGE